MREAKSIDMMKDNMGVEEVGGHLGEPARLFWTNAEGRDVWF